MAAKKKTCLKHEGPLGYDCPCELCRKLFRPTPEERAASASEEIAASVLDYPASTSMEAYAALDIVGKRLRIILWLHEQPGKMGMARECAEAMNIDPESATPRFGELIKLNLARRTEVRGRNSTGRTACKYQLCPELARAASDPKFAARFREIKRLDKAIKCLQNQGRILKSGREAVRQKIYLSALVKYGSSNERP